MTALVLASLAYLTALFALARRADAGRLPSRFVKSPALHALSLGAFASTWTYYGSLDVARANGAGFLALYVGATLGCLLVPFVWAPLDRVVRQRQLTSLADVFAYRYQSPAAGALVTVVLLVGSLPYLAQQVRGVTDAAARLLGLGGAMPAAPVFAAGFCAVVAAFTVPLGARRASAHERNDGLVVAVSIESLFKLLATLIVTAVAARAAFGDPQGIQRWIDAHPAAIDAMQMGASDPSWTTVALLSAVSVFLLPRQFHLAFAESPGPSALRASVWALPAYLFALTAGVPLMLWSHMALDPSPPRAYALLDLARSQGPVLSLLVFVGGVSAASAMMIVTTVALAAMCQRHLLRWTAQAPRDGQRDLYGSVLWTRRALVLAVIAGSYLAHLALERGGPLADLGLVSFVAVAQFVPGVVGVLWWTRATREGLVAGLSLGALSWALFALAPMLARAGVVPTTMDLAARFGVQGWTAVTVISLVPNALAFVALSALSRQREDEHRAALQCANRPHAVEGAVSAESPEAFRVRLAPLLGADAADREVRRALEQCSLRDDVRDPAALRALRERVEQNLSGLVGPVAARLVVDRALALDESPGAGTFAELRALEAAWSEARARGPLARLEVFRRYFSHVLESLPLGVCALTATREILVWNRAMETLTSIPATRARGLTLDALDAPWSSLLATVAAAAREETVTREDGSRLVIELARAQLDVAAQTDRDAGPEAQGTVILVRDLTAQRAMDAAIAHQERLASIGRLAAGVAHEIGNPLTAIALVAQNIERESHEGEPVELDGLRERVSLVISQTKRIDAIVRALLDFSRAGEGATVGRAIEPHALLSVSALVDEALVIARLAAKTRHVTLDRAEIDPALCVRGQRQRLLQVLVNLVVNACDASPEGETVRLSANETDDGQLEITVEDRGHGVPEALRERVFEPFFTTKEAGQGTGLGLSIAYGIVEEHRGALSLSPRDGGGTIALVRLPLR
jgi:signal transduction histidine kinase/Na+/proline symporter